jgi:hypothetical protein
MEQYYTRAREIAAALVEALPVEVAPYPPHTNAFQLYLPGTQSALEETASVIARQDGDWLFGWTSETQVPNLTMVEISVGEATDAWSTEEIVSAFGKLLDPARN